MLGLRIFTYDPDPRPKPSTAHTPSKKEAAPRRPTPREHQAIVFDLYPECEIEHCTKALCSKVSPKDILYASKKPRGQISYYLRSVELAKQVTKQEFEINNGSVISCVQPRLLRPVQTVTISNVSPAIPNSFIEEEILPFYLVSPKSEITAVKSELSGPDFSHVLSFKRQFYIDSQDALKLPKSADIKIGDRVEKVYFTVEK